MKKGTKNKTAKEEILNYTVIYEPAEEGGYTATVPALPGCVTQGRTFNEVQTMAKGAIEAYLIGLQILKEEVPQEVGPALMSIMSVPIPVF